MRKNKRVLRGIGQGAKFIAVIVGLILIFKKQLTSLVNKAFSNINDKAGTL